MKELLDFEFYCRNFLKIQTKTEGLKAFKLSPFQFDYINHIKNDYPDGIIRSIVLKARQSGFSTLVGGINTHKMCTIQNYKTILLADKSSRTDEVFAIYKRFVSLLPKEILPMIDKFNDREVMFDNPKVENRIIKPGLSSGINAETANDKSAGRAGTRMSAHLTEAAYFRYFQEIEESVGNSIPLAPNTSIIYESTANGRSGNGESFYNLWQAAERGDSIYKPFFVAWYKVFNYDMPVTKGFVLTTEEKDILSRHKEMTKENLVWRRMKIRSYSESGNSFFTPEERFKQDFPSFAEEAFLNSGRPVFEQNKLNAHIHRLTNNRPERAAIKIQKPFLTMYQKHLVVYKVPVPGERYVIGADIAEGVEGGDFSHAFVLNEKKEQVAYFHAHIDSDHFGKILVELAKTYNEALLCPEINNMGIATLNSIKNENYWKIYTRTIFDEIAKVETEKKGWRTTKSSKQDMLSRLIAAYRDDDIEILDLECLREMSQLTRESDGDIELTGYDRVVACCLALVALDQLYKKVEIFNPNKKERISFETKDASRDVILAKEKKIYDF